jgi:hypothetical protein
MSSIPRAEPSYVLVLNASRPTFEHYEQRIRADHRRAHNYGEPTRFEFLAKIERAHEQRQRIIRDGTLLTLRFANRVFADAEDQFGVSFESLFERVRAKIYSDMRKASVDEILRYNLDRESIDFVWVRSTHARSLSRTPGTCSAVLAALAASSRS